MRISAAPAACLSIALLLTGCATSPKDFYANPTKADATALCRAYFETHDTTYQTAVGAELIRRGMTYDSCQKRITAQNVGVGIVAAAILGTAVVATCQNGGCVGGGGGYYGGGYGYAWDNIPNGYGGREWRCRDRANGEFADDGFCPVFKSDAWPYN